MLDVFPSPLLLYAETRRVATNGTNPPFMRGGEGWLLSASSGESNGCWRYKELILQRREAFFQGIGFSHTLFFLDKLHIVGEKLLPSSFPLASRS